MAENRSAQVDLSELSHDQLLVLAQRMGLTVPHEPHAGMPQALDNDGSGNIRPSEKALRLGKQKGYLQGQELREFEDDWFKAFTRVDSGYMEPLTDACYLGQLKDARAILDGPDPPSLSSKSTGLELSYVGAAVMAFVTAPSMPPCPDVPEHLAIIKLLIERGAPVDAIDARGDTPLTLAALHGLDSPVVIRMLADAGANLNHRDKGGRTALFTHAQHGRVDSVQALLDAGAQLEIDSADGTSIAAAFLRGGVAVGDVLKRYLRAHPDLPVRLPWKIRGVVQSMPGATLGDGAVNVSPELRALCARPLLNGPTALRFNELYAATAGQLDLRNGLGTLGALALQGRTHELGPVLKNVPVLTMRVSDLSLGLLHLSVLGFRAMVKQQGLAKAGIYLKDMRWLVANGARHAPDLGGVHPISLACNTVDEPSLIETLIDCGANVNVSNKLGRTPLFSAAAAGLCKIVPVLLKAGARLDVRDSDDVPIMRAFRQGGPKMLKILNEWTKTHPDAVVAGVDPVRSHLQDGTGGIVLRPDSELLRLARRPGYLKASDGGSRLLSLFREESMAFDPTRLTAFGLNVFTGNAEGVRTAIEKGEAPDLLASETGHRLGYAQLCVLGQQRLVGAKMPKFEATLRVLHEFGGSAVFKHADLAGQTALFFALQDGAERPGLIDLLIKLGCDVNARTRGGAVPALYCMMENLPAALKRILRAPGVDLTIADADGCAPLTFYSQTGPEICAVMQAHLRAESGDKPEPLQFVACANCNAKGKLLCCSRCLLVLYCSAACLKSHWKEHKPNCEEFAKGARTFKTVESAAFSLTDVMHGGRRNKPKSTADSGSVMTIKVQTAASKLMPILIYNRDRSYTRSIQRADGPEDFDALCAATLAHGIRGVGISAGAAKAYFRSRRDGEDGLMIKISRPLVAQNF